MQVGDTMSIKEARAAIKAAPRCWAWVKITPEDGTYLPITKFTALQALEVARDFWGTEDGVLAHVGDDTQDFYIN